MKIHVSGGSEFALFDGYADALDDGILAVFRGVVGAFEVHAEKASETLPECSAERAEKCFQNVVSALVGFALDEFDEHSCLAS